MPFLSLTFPVHNVCNLLYANAVCGFILHIPLFLWVEAVVVGCKTVPITLTIMLTYKTIYTTCNKFGKIGKNVYSKILKAENILMLKTEISYIFYVMNYFLGTKKMKVDAETQKYTTEYLRSKD